MSHVKIRKAELIKAEATVLKVTRISRDEYSELMFRHGSMFAEKFASKFLNKNDIYQEITQDPVYGFWNWWKLKWQMDDAAILEHDCLDRHEQALRVLHHISLPSGEGRGGAYEQVKEAMVGDELLEDQLYHLINHLL